MTSSVKKLTLNPQKAQKMGYAASIIAKQFTWKKHALNLKKTVTAWKKQPKNIIIVNNAYVSTNSIGGGDRFMIEIASRIKNQNMKLITPQIGLFHWKKSPTKHIRFLTLPKTSFDNKQSTIAIFIAYLLRSVYSFILLHRLPKPDILISTSELTPDILPTYLYKKTHPTTPWTTRIFHLIPSPHVRKGNFAVNSVSWLLQRLSILLIRSCDTVLVDNKLLIPELEKLGIKKNRVEVHYGGVSIDKIRKYTPQSSSQFHAAYVGRLTAHKGIFDLVPIWKLVTQTIPEAKLVIIGNGPNTTRKRLKSQIKSSHLQSNIKLLGFLEHQKGKKMPLFDALKNTKVLLFTDHEAGFGLIVQEAMATGIPVVAYNLPIFGSVYEKGFITSSLGNTKEFASKTIELLTDEVHYSKLSNQALKQAQKFDWSHATAKMNKLFYSL